MVMMLAKLWRFVTLGSTSNHRGEPDHQGKIDLELDKRVQANTFPRKFDGTVWAQLISLSVAHSKSPDDDFDGKIV